MKDSWKANSEERPTFSDIKEELRRMVEFLAQETSSEYYGDGLYINPSSSYYTSQHPDDECGFATEEPARISPQDHPSHDTLHLPEDVLVSKNSFNYQTDY